MAILAIPGDLAARHRHRVRADPDRARPRDAVRAGLASGAERDPGRLARPHLGGALGRAADRRRARCRARRRWRCPAARAPRPCTRRWRSRPAPACCSGLPLRPVRCAGRGLRRDAAAWHDRAPLGRYRSIPAVTRLSDRQPHQRPRPPRDRRLRRGRARARVRHAGVHRRRGRPARPCPRLRRRAGGAQPRQ